MGFLVAALPLMAALGAGGGAAAAGAGLTTAAAVGGMAATAAGGITSAIGSYESGQSAKARADYQAEVAAQNQKLAEQNATLATATGEAQAEQSGMRTKAQAGSIRAAQGASGLDVNSGSAVDVQKSASELGMLDQLAIRSRASSVAYGYETQGINFGGQEKLYQAEAKQAPVAGAIGAAGSLLGSAASVGSQYSQWQRAAGSPAGVQPSWF